MRDSSSLVKVRGLQGPALLAERGVLARVRLAQERRCAGVPAVGAAVAVQVGAGGAVAAAAACRRDAAAAAGVVAAAAKGHRGGEVVQTLVPEIKTRRKRYFIVSH